MRILAIDPGFDRLGMAVVEGDPSRPTLLWSTCVLPEKGEVSERLAHVSRAITSAIAAHAPDALAIETLFFNMNKKTVMGVAQARGAILAAAGIAMVPVIECSPQEIKLAVTGHGASSKASIAGMIPHLLTLPDRKMGDDEYDAIAVGITSLAKGPRALPERQ